MGGVDRSVRFLRRNGYALGLSSGASGAEILADIDNLEKREPSKDTDEHDEYDVRLSALIGELYRASPNHERLVTLLPKRWEFLSSRAVRDPLARRKGIRFSGSSTMCSPGRRTERLHDEAAYYKARTKLGIAQSTQRNPEAALPLIEEFAQRENLRTYELPDCSTMSPLSSAPRTSSSPIS